MTTPPHHDQRRSSMHTLVRTTPFRLRVRPLGVRPHVRRSRRLVLRPDAGPARGAAGPIVTSAWEDGALKLTVDLPGIPRDAVDVSVAGRVLSVAVKTDTLSWQRRLTLGASLDPEQVTAQYADGRLTVVVGPVAEAQPRRIEIETAARRPPSRPAISPRASRTPAPPPDRAARRARPSPARGRGAAATTIVVVPPPTPGSSPPRRRASVAYGITSRSTPTEHTTTTAEPSRRRPSARTGRGP